MSLSGAPLTCKTRGELPWGPSECTLHMNLVQSNRFQVSVVEVWHTSIGIWRDWEAGLLVLGGEGDSSNPGLGILELLDVLVLDSQLHDQSDEGNLGGVAVAVFRFQAR